MSMQSLAHIFLARIMLLKRTLAHWALAAKVFRPCSKLDQLRRASGPMDEGKSVQRFTDSSQASR